MPATVSLTAVPLSPHRAVRCRRRARAPPLRALGAMTASPAAGFPAFLPAERMAEITEPAAQDLARALRRVAVDVDGVSVATAHVPPAQRASAAPPLLLLHGFDSSSFEWRRFLPLAADAGLEVWPVDLYGCGFTAFADGSSCSPVDRRAHLRAFVEQQIGRPCVVLGASLGASAAIDLAVEHPELVTALVIVDGQAFEQAPQLPGPLASLGVQVLRTEWLRSQANKLAYADKDKYATDDAMRVGRLHTHIPSWSAANIAFMASGGYKVADRVAAVTQSALVVWGEDDEIVPPATAQRFKAALPDCRIELMGACGHVPHLEQPLKLLQAVQRFVGDLPVAA